MKSPLLFIKSFVSGGGCGDRLVLDLFVNQMLHGFLAVEIKIILQELNAAGTAFKKMLGSALFMQHLSEAA